MKNEKIEAAKHVIAEQKKIIKDQKKQEAEDKKRAKAAQKLYKDVKKTAEEVTKTTTKLLNEIVDAIGKCPDPKMLIQELQPALEAIGNIEEKLADKYPEAAKAWKEFTASNQTPGTAVA